MTTDPILGIDDAPFTDAAIAAAMIRVRNSKALIALETREQGMTLARHRVHSADSDPPAFRGCLMAVLEDAVTNEVTRSRGRSDILGGRLDFGHNAPRGGNHFQLTVGR